MALRLFELKNAINKEEQEVTFTDEETKKKEYKEHITLKAEVEEYEKIKNTYNARIVVTLSASFICGLIVPFLKDGAASFAGDMVVIVSLGTLFLLLVIFSLLTISLSMSKKRIKLREYEISHAQEQAQEDPFKNAIKTSYTYLDRYYDQTQQQAKQGFGITVVIAVCGALLIFGGVISMYLGFVEPAYITCASGVITEFISSIFFAMYNKTVTSMNSYHDKLVLSQNIAFALRVAGEMEGMGDKNKAKLAIIKELMKDVNAQMMKSDNDDSEPPKKKQSADAEKPSESE